MRATRAIIHLGNLRRNIEAVRRLVGTGPEICVPVKADAYGHGAVEVVRASLEAGATRFAVASASEAAELRAAGISAPILLLSIAIPEELPDAVELGLAPLVADAEYALALAAEARARGRVAEAHIKVDTGMGRIGCRPEDALSLARLVAGTRGLRLGGVCTHFPVADSLKPGALAFTEGQIDIVEALVRDIEAAGIDPGVVHAANSGGVLYHPRSRFGMVRPGILCYGYLPERDPSPPFFPEPVMELETRIAQIRVAEPGETVSYGRTWTAGLPTRIASLPVGYADGYPRYLSGKGLAWVGGKLAPVRGRICMDQTMIDLGPAGEGGVAAQRYDRVSLFGPGPGMPGADDIADMGGTIAYEVTCDINKRVPRVYLD